MKSHTGERNYECSICFKKFLYSYNVVAHIRNVHEKKPEFLTCMYCSKSFTKSQKLQEHMQEVHPEMEESKSGIIEEEEAYYEYEKID